MGAGGEEAVAEAEEGEFDEEGSEEAQEDGADGNGEEEDEVSGDGHGGGIEVEVVESDFVAPVAGREVPEVDGVRVSAKERGGGEEVKERLLGEGRAGWR